MWICAEASAHARESRDAIRESRDAIRVDTQLNRGLTLRVLALESLRVSLVDLIKGDVSVSAAAGDSSRCLRRKRRRLVTGPRS